MSATSRIQADDRKNSNGDRDYKTLVDLNTNDPPAPRNGEALDLEIGCFQGGAIYAAETKLDSLIVEIRSINAGDAPTVDAGLIIESQSETGGNLTALTEAGWLAGTGAHATLSFSGAQMANIVGGTSYWLIVKGIETPGEGGETIVFAAGTFTARGATAPTVYASPRRQPMRFPSWAEFIAVLANYASATDINTAVSSLNADNINTGELNDARLSNNIPLLDALAAFTANLSVGGQAWSALNTLTDAANIATDCNAGNVHTITLGGNRTLDNPTNVEPGATYCWIVVQDGSGSRTLSFGANFKFTDGSVPTLSTGPAAVDVLTAIALNSTTLLVASQLNFS